MKRNMLSIKFFFTSLIFFNAALFLMFSFNQTPDLFSKYFYPCIFFILFLVFFILGWVVKDKPAASKNSTTETNDKNKSE